jgi:hypothetical protein
MRVKTTKLLEVNLGIYFYGLIFDDRVLELILKAQAMKE